MTQMIPVSDDLYTKLQQSAHQRGLQISEYLETLVNAPEHSSDPKAKMTPKNAALYQRIMVLREDIARDMTGREPMDVEAWIREDRER